MLSLRRCAVTMMSPAGSGAALGLPVTALVLLASCAADGAPPVGWVCCAALAEPAPVSPPISAAAEHDNK